MTWRALAVALVVVACQPRPDTAAAPAEDWQKPAADNVARTAVDTNGSAQDTSGSDQAPTLAAEASSPAAPAEPSPSDAGSLEPPPEDDEPVAAAPAATLPDGTPIAPCEAAPGGMSCVPGGPFVRGLNDDPHRCDQSSYNDQDRLNTMPAATVYLQTFYMDRTEVTYEAYQACVKAGQCEKAGPKYRDYNRPLQPITGISWYHARDYCAAHGKHLPTEAEFEAATRGPDGELYPWGNGPEPSCDNAVIMDEQGRRSCGIEKIGDHPEKGRVLEVCARPAGRYDLCDMVGNAEEWVFDWYHNGYDLCGEDCLGVNPRGPCGGAEKCPGHRYKTVRGGSWYWPKEHATGVHRRSHVPGNEPFHHFGFRCAASQDEARALTAAAPADTTSPSAEGKEITP